jgi:phage terminase large subunit GpA-like protein
MKTEIQNPVLDYFKPMPMPEEVLEVLAPRKKQHLLDWMQKFYILPEKSSRIKGAWRLAVTPYWKCVIDWLCDTTTRVIWVYACTQSGKSTIFGGWMGYCIDIDPGPMKIVLPDEKVAKKRIKRLKPAFENSPRILRHLGGDIRNLLIGEPTDLDNMQLILAWPTSPITLSDDPARYIGGDEVSAWVQDVKDDTDAISLLGNRTRTYETVSKQFYVTSPKNKGDLADRNFEACQKWTIHIPCPDCGVFHEGTYENVFMEKTKDKEFLKSSEYKKGHGRGRHAWYQCPACKSLWSELERKAAVSGCRACPEGCSIGTDGEIVGDYDQNATHKAITIPSVLVDPMFTTVDTLAAEFAMSITQRKQGNILPYRNFWNNQNARAWEERERETSLTQLQSHISDYKMGEVPRKVQMICHGIDVQIDYVMVSTKGYGFRNESWLINAQRLETGHTGKAENWDIVERYIRSQWLSKDEKTVAYYAMKAAVDCRYQRAERDEESTVVYDFCLKFPEGTVIPVMGYGRDRMHNMPYKRRDVIGKALHRYDLNVDNGKDRLWQSLYDKDKQPGPGYMHLPDNLPIDILRQLASECQRVKRGRTGHEIVVWEKKEGFKENHTWDTCNYADFAAELAGVFFLQDVDYIEQVMIRKKNETGGPSGRVINEKPIRTKY